METIEGLEVWARDPTVGGGTYIVVITRAANGMYAGWHNPSLDLPFPRDEVVEMLTTGQVEWADLSQVALRDMEFRSGRAAIKWAKRAMSTVMQAAKIPEGWEPKKGWKRVYSGDMTMQAFEENAAARRAAEKVAQITKEIEEHGRKDIKSMTDSEYAAHRRRKIELKRQRSQLQGGDNA